MQTAKANHNFTEVYNTVKKKKGKLKKNEISESNIIFHFFLYLQKYQSLADFLTPLSAPNFFFLKSKFYRQTKQRSGFVLLRDSSTSQPASSYPERKSQHSRSTRLAQPQPTLVTPRKFSLTPCWLSTHSGTCLQILRCCNLLLTLIFQGNTKSNFMIKLFCSKFSLFVYPCRMLHSNTANFSHQHQEKFLNKRQ